MLIKRKKRLLLTVIGTIFLMHLLFPLCRNQHTQALANAYYNRDLNVEFIYKSASNKKLKLISHNFRSIGNGPLYDYADKSLDTYGAVAKIHHSHRNFNVEFKAPASGTLKIKFFAPDNNWDKGKYFPLFVYYNNLTVNGKNLFTKEQKASLASPHITEIKVTPDQHLKISFQARRDMQIDLLRAINLPIFLSLLIISFLIVRNVIYWISKFKIFEHKSRIDIVFLSTFFVLLILPMTNINDHEKSEQENRMLATYQNLISPKGGINLTYGKNFENWFNDHFLGREFAIEKFNRLKFALNSKLETEKAIMGKDNWIFYKRDGNIANFQNSPLYSEKELARIATTLNQMQLWCDRHHKKFYFVVPPNKHKIYGEYFIDVKKIRPDTQSKTHQLIAYLKQHTNIKTIYLYDTLMQHKKDGLLYWKNDTHWNPYGAYIGYQQIMHEIRKDFPQLKIVKASSITSKGYPKGDLTAYLFPKPEKHQDNTLYPYPNITDTSTCKDVSDSDKFCTNPKGKLNLFMIRDSFTSNLQKYLAQSFKNINFLWRQKLMTFDQSNLEQADIIIVESIERLIYQLDIDMQKIK